MARVVQRADHWNAVPQHADGHAVVGDAARVVRRAVDRIDDPQPLGLGHARRAAFFLAQHRVVRVARGDRRPDEALDRRVHLGEHVVSAFHRGG
jgi:hypothetical protein